jgi:hypothetical protein
MNTNTDLCSAALATVPAAHVSSKYKHVRTLDLLAPLFDAGWVVDSQIVTKSARPEHAKHALKLSNRDLAITGEYRPQIVVRNGSNGDAALQVSAGLYRFACANGIVAGASCLTVKVSHRGNDLQARAVAAVETVAERLPSLTETVARWSSKTLTEAAQDEFARRAAALRWDTSESLTVNLSDLSASRRYDDYGSDLWHTFNRVQETLIKGGARVTRRLHSSAGRYDHSAGVFVEGPTFYTDTRDARAVNSIEANLKINTSLWNLAEEFSNS